MVYRKHLCGLVHARSHTKAHSVVENYISNTLDYVNGGYFCGPLQLRVSEIENNRGVLDKQVQQEGLV